MNKIPANKSIRLINFIIDSFVSYFTISLIIIAVYYDFDNEKLVLDKTTRKIYFLIGVGLYYMIFEFFFQKTIGKFITKTNVVRLDSKKLSFFNVLVRTLCRFIPIYWVSFLGSSNRGWHDILSKTNVVSKS